MANCSRQVRIWAAFAALLLVVVVGAAFYSVARDVSSDEDPIRSELENQISEVTHGDPLPNLSTYRGRLMSPTGAAIMGAETEQALSNSRTGSVLAPRSSQAKKSSSISSSTARQLHSSASPRLLSIDSRLDPSNPLVNPLPPLNGAVGELIRGTKAISYRPGDLAIKDNGLLLSRGLQSRIIARSGQSVRYKNGKKSSRKFHGLPDFGATFPISSGSNKGGWVYVSNSEIDKGKGGVGAITFDKNGNVIDYEMILTGTTRNCAGGKTPWNTWISCEETAKGRVFEVDPFGKRSAKTITMDQGGGRFESFAYDDRNRRKPYFYVSEDSSDGALRRWTPNKVDWSKPRDMLHGSGKLEYLILDPSSKDNSKGTFTWTTDKDKARKNAKKYYPYSEGIDRDGNLFFMVCKTIKMLFILNLDKNTYIRRSTRQGKFDGAPDQMKRVLNDKNDILYFTEEGGRNTGVHGRTRSGRFFTILEGQNFKSETTGLSFSPNGKHMYVAFQDDGVLFDIWRDDGEPFHGKTLNVQDHGKNSPI